jgi:hypothetical protein
MVNRGLMVDLRGLGGLGGQGHGGNHQGEKQAFHGKNPWRLK